MASMCSCGPVRWSRCRLPRCAALGAELPGSLPEVTYPRAETAERRSRRHGARCRTGGAVGARDRCSGGGPVAVGGRGRQLAVPSRRGGATAIMATVASSNLHCSSAVSLCTWSSRRWRCGVAAPSSLRLARRRWVGGAVPVRGVLTRPRGRAWCSFSARVVSCRVEIVSCRDYSCRVMSCRVAMDGRQWRRGSEVKNGGDG